MRLFLHQWLFDHHHGNHNRNICTVGNIRLPFKSHSQRLVEEEISGRNYESDYESEHENPHCIRGCRMGAVCSAVHNLHLIGHRIERNHSLLPLLLKQDIKRLLDLLLTGEIGKGQLLRRDIRYLALAFAKFCTDIVPLQLVAAVKVANRCIDTREEFVDLIVSGNDKRVGIAGTCRHSVSFKKECVELVDGAVEARVGDADVGRDDPVAAD